jgi:hypothetical protein
LSPLARSRRAAPAWLAALICGIGLALPGVSRAQTESEAKTGTETDPKIETKTDPKIETKSEITIDGRHFSPLEQERITRALERQHGTIEPHPEGKRIESIEIVALEVFEPEDPVPQFVNWFHPTTRNYVIERELLMHIGSRYDKAVSDETERNLRGLGLFSVVVALPMKGSSESSVRYLVVTKDLWSLRVGWNIRINKGVVDYLALSPTEFNLFGTGRRLYSSLVFGRRTYSLGAGFVEPRLAGSHIELTGNVNATISCSTGQIEGSQGGFTYTYPLYSSRTPWSYGTSVAWRNGRSPLNIPNKALGSICSLDAPEEGIVHGVGWQDKAAYYPNLYVFDSQSFNQFFTRSYGVRYKTNVSFGLEAIRSAARGVDLSNIRAAPSDVPGDLTEWETSQVESFYRRQLPRSSRRVSPYFQLQSFTTDYHPDLNADTLALQESYRLGHIATLRVYPALKAVGSSRNLLGVSTSLSYATAVDTGYLKATASQLVELSKLNQTDARLSLGLHFNSPRFVLGRFVYDGVVVDRYFNFQNGAEVLGGTGRLRGYQATVVSGQHAIISNLEFRSRPIQIVSAQLAAVLFHDMGDAFNKVGDLHLLHGVGFGLRFLLPELDRDVFRVDVGFPVPSNAPGGETSVIATFGQAFDTP